MDILTKLNLSRMNPSTRLKRGYQAYMITLYVSEPPQSTQIPLEACVVVGETLSVRMYVRTYVCMYVYTLIN
jgi:hypothetical protein